ncbi:MAG: glycosyltransferase family 4 protein [Phycisphaeraceae bacterium]
MKPLHLVMICGVVDAHQPEAAETVLLANDLAERGYRVTLLAMSFGDLDMDPRVTLKAAGTRPRWFWISMIRYLRWLSKEMKRLKPDHMISMLSSVTAEIMVPLTGTQRARCRAKRSLCLGMAGHAVQHLSELHPNVALPKQLERRAISRDGVKLFIAVSQPIEEQLQADLSGKSTPIELASVARPESRIDTKRSAQLREELARAWGINRDGYWIILPFSDAAVDGFEPMLRAMKPLIDQGVDAVLLLSGPTRYTHLAWIGQLGLRDRIRFVGETSMVQELLAACDLIVCPTSYDPAGWAVRPALGLGKPIVTTSASAAAEDVMSQGGSVLPSPVQPQALLEVIRELHARWEDGDATSIKTAPKLAAAPTLAQIVDRWLQPDDDPA